MVLPGGLLNLLLMLCIAGVALWALGELPIDAAIKKIIRVVIIVVVACCVIYWLVGMLGAGFPRLR